MRSDCSAFSVNHKLHMDILFVWDVVILMGDEQLYINIAMMNLNYRNALYDSPEAYCLCLKGLCIRRYEGFG